MDDGSSAAAEISDTDARHPTHCLWTLNEFYTSVGATSIKKDIGAKKFCVPTSQLCGSERKSIRRRAMLSL
jgi:squalene cyclase